VRFSFKDIFGINEEVNELVKGEKGFGIKGVGDNLESFANVTDPFFRLTHSVTTDLKKRLK